MATELSPKEIGLRWFNEVWNQRAIHLIPELMAPDAVGHLEGGQDVVGPEGFLAFQSAILQTLPDVQVEILNVLAEGDHVSVFWRVSATHTGHGMGFTPTGKPVTFQGSSWLRCQNGRMVEGWDTWNQAALFATLAAPSTS
ncbi:MAG: ester cyclase [Chthoniobacteraceae bacterium]